MQSNSGSLPAFLVLLNYCTVIQNTQQVKENAFYLHKTEQYVRNFEKVLSSQATYNRKTINAPSLCQFDAGGRKRARDLLYVARKFAHFVLLYCEQNCYMFKSIFHEPSWGF